VNPAVAALGAIVGAGAGLAVGFVAFLLATFFPHLLHTALPGMTPPWFLGLWIAALAIPILAFRTVFRNGKGLGTKVYAVCGIAIVAGLFAADLTGIKRVFPWSTQWYLAPAIGQPETPSPLRR
jgi:ABC-type arginine transport system permease subunit